MSFSSDAVSTAETAVSPAPFSALAILLTVDLAVPVHSAAKVKFLPEASSIAAFLMSSALTVFPCMRSSAG